MGKIIAVKENFLPKEFDKRLQSLLESNNLAWYFEPRSLSTKDDGNFMFTHSLFNRKNNFESKWLKLFDPILYFVADIIAFRDCVRMKMNCYPNRGQITRKTYRCIRPYYRKTCRWSYYLYLQFYYL